MCLHPVLVTGVTGDVRPDTCDFIRDKISSITKSDSAGMVIAVCIMTGAAVDYLAGCHIVAVGVDRFSVMTGQDIVNWRGMTHCTGIIRGRG